MREPVILWEGTCAYAVLSKGAYSIRVHSSNHVEHVAAGEVRDAAQAERLVRRLNAYPQQTRQFHGLL